MNLVIAGVQGSGKGTQATEIARKQNITHISTGDILRDHIAKKTKLGVEYQRAYKEGKFASDEIIFGIISEALTPEVLDNGFILDGFPRSETQANWLMENYSIDGCIHLYLDDDTARDRMKYRYREDDTPEAIEFRLKEYHEKTEPAIFMLPNVMEIIGDQEISEVTEDIEESIEKLKSKINIQMKMINLPPLFQRIMLILSNESFLYGMVMLTIIYLLFLAN